MKERIRWIDALKFFAIFLVLWGHSIQYLQTIPYWEQPVYRIIYSFHMPLFMALSGFFAANISKKPLLKVLKDKSRQLLLPILSLAGIFFIIRQFCLWGIIPKFRFIYFYPEEGFWFLKSAFFCSIIYYFVSKCKKLYIPLLLISIFLSQISYLHSFYQIDIMYPSFIFGVMINKNLKWIIQNSVKIMLILGLLFLLMLLFWDASFWKFVSFYDSSSGVINYQNMMIDIYRHFYRLIIGLTATLFFISLFEYLSHKIPVSKFGDLVIKYGSYTLGIYLIQSFFLEKLIALYIKFDDLNPILFNFIICPLISVGILFICIGIIELLKKFPFTNFLFLGANLTNFKRYEFIKSSIKI